MSEVDVTAFSADQQGAIFGHALQDPNLWYRFDIVGMTKDWCIDARLGDLFDVVKDHRERFKRPPGADELVEHWCLKVGADQRATARRTVDWCIKSAAGLGKDLLVGKLQEWARSRIIAEHTVLIAKAYNAGKHGDAVVAAERQAIALHKLQVQSGTADTFISAYQRIKGESTRRAAENADGLTYGISYLNDALIKIRAHDLIVLGARPGAGKTEAAKMIAEHNARLNKRVFFFALEAEEDEIERRIKFGMISRRYIDDHPGIDREVINYPDWLMGNLEQELSYLDDWAEERFEKELSTLETFYRVRDDFRVEDLDREVMRVHKEADLIIIDHLHYVDTNHDDENAEMNKLMKKLRDLAIALGVPILCVAHLRKNKGKAQSLVPDFDDFHGSSAISKIATVGIILAPATGATGGVDGRCIGEPTFMRIVKCRVGGDRLQRVAVAYYDRQAGCYGDDYALGSLNFSDTKWTAKNKPPRWAKHATIEDMSDAG